MTDVVKEVVQRVKRTVPSGRGRRPVLPGTQVLERYKNGQPSLYQFRNERLTRRQYHILVRELQEEGALPPRKSWVRKSGAIAS